MPETYWVLCNNREKQGLSKVGSLSFSEFVEKNHLKIKDDGYEKEGQLDQVQEDDTEKNFQSDVVGANLIKGGRSRFSGQSKKKMMLRMPVLFLLVVIVFAPIILYIGKLAIFTTLPSFVLPLVEVVEVDFLFSFSSRWLRDKEIESPFIGNLLFLDIEVLKDASYRNS
ncbi:hypothetical protein NE237_022078 [Protea cynaroides]|uniref:Uncharacterized protein n=1 Tax=Protea cynaroides TaxID=273540 RepID=A0A9Q0HEF5_9MAGN|nr:hypothetical protein NE237_022078 [Protea cynaroides]